VPTELRTDREDIALALDRMLAGTQFALVPDMVEQDLTMQTGLIVFTMKVLGLPVRIEATALAVDGQIEVNITRAIGLLKGIVRPFVETQIVLRLKPWSAYVRVGRAANGNLRFWRPDVRVTDVSLGEDEFRLTFGL
jgi:hypothetical protein